MIPWKQMTDCIIHLLFPTKTTLSRRPRHRTEQDQTHREHSCCVSKSIEERRSEHQDHSHRGGENGVRRGRFGQSFCRLLVLYGNTSYISKRFTTTGCSDRNSHYVIPCP